MINLNLFRKQLIEAGWNPTIVYSMTDQVLIYIAEIYDFEE